MLNESTSSPMTLGEVLRACRRHWVGMGLIVGFCIGIGILMTITTKPIWRASTEIVVEGRTSPNQSTDPIVATSLPGQDSDVLTQIEVIQSSKLIQAAMRDAGVAVPVGESDIEDTPGAPRVKADQVEATNAVSVTVDSTNPGVAQSVAASIPHVYSESVKASGQQEVDSALDFLSAQMTREEKDLNQAQADLQKFKNGRPLAPLEAEGSQRSMTVTESEGAVAQAQAEVAGARKRLDTLVAERRATPTTIQIPTIQSNAAAIESEKGVIAELKIKLASAASHYTAENSHVADLNAQIAAAEKRLQEMPQVLNLSATTRNPELSDLDAKIDEANSQLKAALASQEKINARSAETQAQLKSFNKIEPKQDALQRLVDQHQQTLAGIRRDIEELRIRRNAAHDPVAVLSAPGAAVKISPRPGMNLFLGGALGMFFAIGFALLREAGDDRIRSNEPLFDLIGAPALGEVAALPRGAPVLASAELDPSVLESYRILSFNLLFATLEDPVRSLMVTSTGPAEGKTELACNLAVAASGPDRRVILVDVNFSRPSIHQKMNVTGKPGLTDVISGESTLDGALHQTKIPGLRVLTIGGPIEDAANLTASSDSPLPVPFGLPGSSADLLSSERMRTLYRQLLERADLVIFDGPPCLQSADALVLGNMVGATVMVAKEGSTRRSKLVSGMTALRQARSRVIGVAITTGPIRRSRKA